MFKQTVFLGLFFFSPIVVAQYNVYEGPGLLSLTTQQRGYTYRGNGGHYNCAVYWAPTSDQRCLASFKLYTQMVDHLNKVHRPNPESELKKTFRHQDNSNLELDTIASAPVLPRPQLADPEQKSDGNEKKSDEPVVAHEDQHLAGFSGMSGNWQMMMQAEALKTGRTSLYGGLHLPPGSFCDPANCAQIIK